MQIRGLDGRTICGRRARVEMSNGGRGYGGRGPPPRSRLPPRPYDDRCYDCGDRGHYARDCSRRRRRRYKFISVNYIFIGSGSSVMASWLIYVNQIFELYSELDPTHKKIP